MNFPPDFTFCFVEHSGLTSSINLNRNFFKARCKTNGIKYFVEMFNRIGNSNVIELCVPSVSFAKEIVRLIYNDDVASITDELNDDTLFARCANVFEIRSTKSAINPKRDYLIVYNNKSILIYDPVESKFINEIKPDKVIRAVKFHPTLPTAIVTLNDTVVFYNLFDGTVTGMIAIEPNDLYVSPDNSTLFTINCSNDGFNGSINLYGMQNLNLIRSYKLPYIFALDSTLMTLSPDAKTLAFAIIFSSTNTSTRRVYTMDLTTSDVTFVDSGEIHDVHFIDNFTLCTLDGLNSAIYAWDNDGRWHYQNERTNEYTFIQQLNCFVNSNGIVRYIRDLKCLNSNRTKTYTLLPLCSGSSIITKYLVGRDNQLVLIFDRYIKHDGIDLSNGGYQMMCASY